MVGIRRRPGWDRSAILHHPRSCQGEVKKCLTRYTYVPIAPGRPQPGALGDLCRDDASAESDSHGPAPGIRSYPAGCRVGGRVTVGGRPTACDCPCACPSLPLAPGAHDPSLPQHLLVQAARRAAPSPDGRAWHLPLVSLSAPDWRPWWESAAGPSGGAGPSPPSATLAGKGEERVNGGGEYRRVRRVGALRPIPLVDGADDR
jgi:hypothetical protein